MKLYATATSERATKGQGGNTFIRIELIGEDKNFTGNVLLDAILHIKKINNNKIEYALIGKTKTPQLYYYLNCNDEEYQDYLNKNNIIIEKGNKQ